jgi:hypothetical protein
VQFQVKLRKLLVNFVLGHIDAEVGSIAISRSLNADDSQLALRLELS